MEKKEIFTPTLSTQRKMFIANILIQNKVKSVLELGCGSGKVLQYLKEDEYPILDGMDINQESLELAVANLEPNFIDCIHKKKKIVITLYQGDLFSINSKWKEYDCVILTEVIEHVNEVDVDKFKNVIDFLEPKLVIITTPNCEVNSLMGIEKTKYRDEDHKFEWNRSEFKNYIYKNWENSDYSIEITGVGNLKEEYDDTYGFATQIAVLKREYSISKKKLSKKDHFCIIKYELF